MCSLGVKKSGRSWERSNFRKACWHDMPKTEVESTLQIYFTNFYNKTYGYNKETKLNTRIMIRAAERYQPFRTSQALVASSDASLLACAGSLAPHSQIWVPCSLGAQNATPICRSRWTSPKMVFRSGLWALEASPYARA